MYGVKDLKPKHRRENTPVGGLWSMIRKRSDTPMGNNIFIAKLYITQQGHTQVHTDAKLKILNGEENEGGQEDFYHFMFLL